ncbi:MAG: GTPase Era [Desulfuromonadales bacterium]|jgi:GTP-binding protein Era|nr:GTPase Era [Desulfuromonadales bacterium]MDH3961317.1 GTPase Era [Desulfuromonadales bacterium]MDH4026191.1 GTPase Era [Desulfuromonadales bacterium]
MAAEEKFHSGFVAIIGRPNVGKSTLLNHIVGQKIAITSPKPQTTRNRILGIQNLENAQVLFVDTPGIHEAHSPLNRYMVDQARSAALDVDVVLWLVEADRPVDTDPMIPKLLEKSTRPVLLVINKIDTMPKDKLLPLIAAYSKICPFASIVPISALKGDGVEALMNEIPQLLPEGPRYYPEDQLTDVPERFIVAEMIREQILMRTKDEVPYGVAILVERFQENPVKNMVGIDAVINVERDSQKGILIGKGGTMLRQIGQGARKEIERMLGVKVHLQLFVRVQKNWTSSGRMMKEFGYE